MVQPPPGPPGAFTLPAPVQALKDAATQTNPAVPAVAGTVATEAPHGAKPKVGVGRRTRKARLRLSRLDPWSVMKTSFLLSIALWFTDNRDEGVFVGLWVPSILAAGGFWMAAVRTR